MWLHAVPPDAVRGWLLGLSLPGQQVAGTRSRAWLCTEPWEAAVRRTSPARAGMAARIDPSGSQCLFTHSTELPGGRESSRNSRFAVFTRPSSLSGFNEQQSTPGAVTLGVREGEASALTGFAEFLGALYPHPPVCGE